MIMVRRRRIGLSILVRARCRPGIRFSWVLGWWAAGGRPGLADEGLSDGDEAGERCGEPGGPGPADVDIDPGLALAADDPGGGVQQAVRSRPRYQVPQGPQEPRFGGS